MIKQIFGKLPRKPSKSLHNNDSNGEGAVNSYYSPPSSSNTISNPSANGTLAPNKKIQPFGAYEPLPSFRDVPISEKPNLFIKKLSMCCVVFDFRDHSKNLKEKEIKRQTLLELIDYVASLGVKFNEAAMQEVKTMVAVNLFRTFPSANRETNILEMMHDMEDEEPSLEPAWLHIQVVYELLLRFVHGFSHD